MRQASEPTLPSEVVLFHAKWEEWKCGVNEERIGQRLLEEGDDGQDKRKLVKGTGLTVIGSVEYGAWKTGMHQNYQYSIRNSSEAGCGMRNRRMKEHNLGSKKSN